MRTRRPRDISQLADVAAGTRGSVGQVEILLSLNSVDPPVGQLRVTPGRGSAPGRAEDKEFPFTGWLGLLRALYEATGSTAGGPPVTRDTPGAYLVRGTRPGPDPRHGGIMECTRKHTLVTGCSSGIGRATALRLAAAGQHVYAGVRSPADGDQLARSAAGGEITPLILDITVPSHIASAAGAVTGHTAPGWTGWSTTPASAWLAPQNWSRWMPSAGSWR